MKLNYVIKHSNPRWLQVLESAISDIRQAANDGDIQITAMDVIRSLDQNAKMWPMLQDFANQVPMVINGATVMGDAHDWKALLTSAFDTDTRMALGLRGGFVMLGARTSKYDKRKMADFITFMYAEGVERDVEWSEKSKQHMTSYAPELRMAA